MVCIGKKIHFHKSIELKYIKKWGVNANWFSLSIQKKKKSADNCIVCSITTNYFLWVKSPLHSISVNIDLLKNTSSAAVLNCLQCKTSVLIFKLYIKCLMIKGKKLNIQSTWYFLDVIYNFNELIENSVCQYILVLTYFALSLSLTLPTPSLSVCLSFLSFKLNFDERKFKLLTPSWPFYIPPSVSQLYKFKKIVYVCYFFKKPRHT